MCIELYFVQEVKFLLLSYSSCDRNSFVFFLGRYWGTALWRDTCLMILSRSLTTVSKVKGAHRANDVPLKSRAFPPQSALVSFGQVTGEALTYHHLNTNIASWGLPYERVSEDILCYGDHRRSNVLGRPAITCAMPSPRTKSGGWVVQMKCHNGYSGPWSLPILSSTLSFSKG